MKKVDEYRETIEIALNQKNQEKIKRTCTLIRDQLKFLLFHLKEQVFVVKTDNPQGKIYSNELKTFSSNLRLFNIKFFH